MKILRTLFPFFFILVFSQSSRAGYSPFGDIHWKAPVASVAALPSSGNSLGDTRLETTAFGIYTWNGSAWIAPPTSGAGAFTTLSASSTVTFTALTASEAVFTDASKNLVSNPITGTGNVVMSMSPTLVTPALGTPSALVGTNITGTASGLTAGNVTTNANLTGPITSSGNATAIAAQTGTGTTFVMSAGPTVSGLLTESASGAANTSAVLISGVPYPLPSPSPSASPIPLVLVQPSGQSASTSWSNLAGGTAIGVNEASSFLGNFFDVQLNGVSKFSVSSSGVVTGVGSGLTSLNGSNISSGTVPAARLPNPSASTLGGIESLVAVAHKWINTISTSGVPSATQPALSDLSDTPSANTFAAGPASGAAAAATYRAIGSADLAAATNTQSNWFMNCAFSAAISANTVVVTLTQNDASTAPTAAAPCIVGFRSATAGTSSYSPAAFTATLATTIGSTASLGNPSGAGAVIYVYLLKDTSNDVCVSNAVIDDGTLQSATATPATASGTLYCTSAHTSRPIRAMGRITATWSNPIWSAITESALIPFRTISKQYPGTVFPFAGSTCPPNTIIGDGSAISRTTYSTLFGVLGTTYGTGDGSTTFNMPDYRGIFLRGAGTNGTLAYSVGGSAAASALGSYVNDQEQGHDHSLTDPGHNHTQNAHSHAITVFAEGVTNTGNYAPAWATTTFGTGSGNNNGSNTSAGNYAINTTATNNSSTTGITIGSPSSDGTNGTPRTGTETRPFNTAVTYCVWY